MLSNRRNPIKLFSLFADVIEFPLRKYLYQFILCNCIHADIIMIYFSIVHSRLTRIFVLRGKQGNVDLYFQLDLCVSCLQIYGMNHVILCDVINMLSKWNTLVFTVFLNQMPSWKPQVPKECGEKLEANSITGTMRTTSIEASTAEIELISNLLLLHYEGSLLLEVPISPRNVFAFINLFFPPWLVCTHYYLFL